MKPLTHNERFGDSRGETLLKRNSVTSATVPCRIFSVPPPDRQAATTLYTTVKISTVIGRVTERKEKFNKIII